MSEKYALQHIYAWLSASERKQIAFMAGEKMPLHISLHLFATRRSEMRIIMKKRIAFIAVFAVILTLLLLRFSRVFSFKYDDGIYSVEQFYKLPKNSVDVLCLGTSHTYMDYNPCVLWEELGVTSYNLAGSFATMWNNYYALKEALRYQTPKLVILDAYYVTYDNEFTETATAVKNTFGLRSSKNKADAKQAAFSSETLDSYKYDFFNYHTRYASLTWEDYLPYKGNPYMYGNSLGFFPNVTAYGFSDFFASDDGERIPLYEKSEEYYRKIIELCKENDIEIMVCVAPYFTYYYHHNSMLNTAKDIAGEYNVPFYNFNVQPDIDIDLGNDFCDPAHLNLNGSKKYTRYIAGIIKENYDLPNHLADKDSRFDRWRAAAEYLERYETASVLCQFDNFYLYSQYISMLPEDFIVIFNQKGEMYDSDGVCSFFNTVNVPIEYTRELTWIYDTATKETLTLSAKKGGYMWSRKYVENELVIDENGIFINGTNYEKNELKNNVVVLDKRTGAVIDSIYFENDDIFR